MAYPLATELKGAIRTATTDRLRETLQRIVDHSPEARVIATTELKVTRSKDLELELKEREDESSDEYADLERELRDIRRGTAVDVSAYVDSEDEAEYQKGLEDELERLKSKSKKRKRDTDRATQHPRKRAQGHEICAQCYEEYDVLRNGEEDCVWHSSEYIIFGASNVC